jgi:hypothetical protein
VDGVTRPVWLTQVEHRTLRAVMDRLIPGAGEAGAADYVDRLLGAFSFDPPRIWAGGPFSGRHGGEAGFEQWLELGPVEEIAWRIRIEGTKDRPDRSFNGPAVGWQDRYRAALSTLGADFAEQPDEEQDRRVADLDEDDRTMIYEHGCEAHYGDPVYGGNVDGAGWQAIGFDGDVLPRGWTDAEVAEP